MTEIITIRIKSHKSTIVNETTHVAIKLDVNAETSLSGFHTCVNIYFDHVTETTLRNNTPRLNIFERRSNVI